jgi:hypothetical protein
MSTNEMTLIKESGSGKLYESNGFVVPVLTGPVPIEKAYRW